MTDLEKEKQKIYRQKNKEKQIIYRQNQKERIKNWHINNKENASKKAKEYYITNKEKIKQASKKNYNEKKEIYLKKNKKYRENNKEKINKKKKIYIKDRKENNLLYKLKCIIRVRIVNSIKKQGYTKKSKSFEILGCTFEYFKLHLERQFKKGMTWQNHGEWHLDHIYPVSLAKDEAELIKLNHYTNFQPMWAAENIIKGNKIIPNTQIKLI